MEPLYPFLEFSAVLEIRARMTFHQIMWLTQIWCKMRLLNCCLRPVSMVPAQHATQWTISASLFSIHLIIFEVWTIAALNQVLWNTKINIGATYVKVTISLHICLIKGLKVKFLFHIKSVNSLARFTIRVSKKRIRCKLKCISIDCVFVYTPFYTSLSRNIGLFKQVIR